MHQQNVAGKKKILFLTLKIFSATGGIEKICKIAGKVFWEKSLECNMGFRVYAMYDKAYEHDSKYFPKELFKGFNGKKFFFALQSLKTAFQSDIVILSHVNLLFFGFLIKLIKPSVKLILFAHGIEVWKTFNKLKVTWLNHCNTIICVSHFTKEKLLNNSGINKSKYVVINNCLDPYLPDFENQEKNPILLSKYNLTKENIVLLTLSRLSAHDRDKGYEKVLESVRILKREIPLLVYIIAGKYDAAEKEWLEELINAKDLNGSVIITGYVAESELADHFSLCDIYVMPSLKEGFGIIFIEAMYYGKPVLGGNKDGSVDALRNGELGLLVDPENVKEITEGIRKIILNMQNYVASKGEVLQYFGYETYKHNLSRVLYHN